MNFLKNLKDRAKAWLLSKYSAGATAASSFWANVIALGVGGLPDLISWCLQNVDLITGSLPTLSLENKVRFLLFMNAAAAISRLWKQNSVQKASLKQAAEQGRVTSSHGTDAIVIRDDSGAVQSVVRQEEAKP